MTRRRVAASVAHRPAPGGLEPTSGGGRLAITVPGAGKECSLAIWRPGPAAYTPQVAQGRTMSPLDTQPACPVTKCLGDSSMGGCSSSSPIPSHTPSLHV